MPIHFSNPDVLWKSEHPFPRFGQGAFKLALRALYTERLRFLRVPSETIDERIAAFKQWVRARVQQHACTYFMLALLSHKRA